MPTGHPSPLERRRRLDAWKAIAQYLERDVTTVRRWERREGLPVHRHQHVRLGSVYAFTDEIDEWLRRRSDGPQVLEPQPRPVVHQAVASSSPQPRRRFLRPAFGLALVVVATVVMSSSPWIHQSRARKSEIQRFAMPLSPGLLIDSVAISPDGSTIAIAAIDGKVSSLWIRSLDSTDAHAIKGTSGASFPFWSPDGRDLGFFAEGRLKRVAVSGGKVIDLAPAPGGRGGAWNSRGDIVYSPSRRSPLMRIPASGGAPQTITTIGATPMEGHSWPQFLPDGRRFLFTDYTLDSRRNGIYIGDLDTGSVTRVLPVLSAAAYTPDGFLLYAPYSRNALVAHRFDLERLEFIGEPANVAERVMHRGSDMGQFIDFTVSRDGTLIARTAAEERNKLVLFDRDTQRVVASVAEPGYYGNPILSPDNERVIASVTEADNAYRLWTFDLKRGTAARLTSGKSDYVPVFSPKGDRIVYSSSRASRGSGVYERNLLTGQETMLRPAQRMQSPESWSPDGKYVMFKTMSTKGKYDIWAWEMSSMRAFAVVDGPAEEGQSQFSPNSRFIAYTSDESGTFEVYVREFQSPSGAVRVSSAGGADARWRADGRELYYLDPDGRMMAVRVTQTGTFKAGKPVALFETGISVFWNDTRNHYDVTSDGRRFVVLVPEMERRKAPFTVIVNWQK